MLIQKIEGGLGNQMFQYAFIKALSLRKHVGFKLDISEYKTYFRPYELEIFNIEKKYSTEDEIPFYEKKFKSRYYSYINNVFLKPSFSKINKNHFKEREGMFESDFLNKSDGYFEGYFQNENYFKDFESEIRKDFTITKPLSKKNTDLLESLDGKNTISVHIRRGDYLKKPDFHPLCSPDYYNKAIKYICDNVKNPYFIFFSDDLEWVKKNFKGDYYIDWNTGEKSWQDMILMSKCKYNIIANSSFSWWGAWLNNNPNKIIVAPKLRSYKKTFNFNCVPSNWIQF